MSPCDLSECLKGRATTKGFLRLPTHLKCLITMIGVTLLHQSVITKSFSLQWFSISFSIELARYKNFPSLSSTLSRTLYCIALSHY